MKAPAKIPWSSRIALKQHHPADEGGAVLHGLSAVGGPRGLDPVPAHQPRSRAKATDAAARAAEAVAENEVEWAAGSGADSVEAANETVSEIYKYAACGRPFYQLSGTFLQTWILLFFGDADC